MSEFAKPAVLVVHGEFMEPYHWKEFLESLSEAGFITRCPRLPTCGDRDVSEATLQDDVDVVRKVALELAAAGHPIIVLAHSWGGHVASEAIREDLYANKKFDGCSLRTGVIHLIYLNAWLLDAGQRPAEASSAVCADTGPPTKMRLGSGPGDSEWLQSPVEVLYNDTEVERAQQSKMKPVLSCSWSELNVEGSHAPWKDIPTTYVYCTQDASMALGLQKYMVEKAIEIDGSADISTETCDSGNCHFISMPAEVIRIVETVWRKW